MYAVLGSIQFNLITYFDGFQARFGVEYAEHPLLKGKPRLQATGGRLDEIQIELAFNHVYCQPEVELVKLKNAMATQQALSFAMGNGDYKGRFVITELEATSRQTDRVGTVLCMEARVSLKEFVPPPGPPAKTGPAVTPAPPSPNAKNEPWTIIRGNTVPAPISPVAKENSGWSIIPGSAVSAPAPEPPATGSGVWTIIRGGTVPAPAAAATTITRRG